MARTKGPLFSLDASGTIGKVIVYSQWKGRSYCREYEIPANPSTTTQVNLRAAWTLAVAAWQAQGAPAIAAWNAYAEPFQMSGFNKFMSRGIDAYMTQHGTSKNPTAVSVVGDPPADVWVWDAV